MPRLPIQVCIHIVCQEEGRWKTLVLKRAGAGGSFWQPVTGGVEDGETLLEAAKREVYEETGLDVILYDIDYKFSYPLNPLFRHKYAPDITLISEHVFIAVSSHPELILSDEHDEHRWVELSEASRYLTAFNTQFDGWQAALSYFEKELSQLRP